MKTTTNYGLKKPESTDMYNIEDFNENADKIDTTLFELNRRANNNAQSATNAWTMAQQAGDDLESHTRNKSNPHNVTKSQIGLGNVPNVATNDQTPTYTVASSDTALTSGEKLSVAFGKIAKAINSLISHLSNKSNPHTVTKSQVGLGNVDNTSDANKPVSTAQQKALDLKADKTEVALKADHEEIIGENLIPYPYLETTHTDNGITWTDLGDGRIKANGTATADSVFLLPAFTVPKGTYTISGSIDVENTAMQLSTNGSYAMSSNWQQLEKTLTYDTDTNFNYCRILIKSGVTVTNVIFKPMLEKGSVAHEYQPYNKSRDGIIEQITAENLLSFPYFENTKTHAGITYTVNPSDGSVTVSGTSTGSFYIYRSRGADPNPLLLPAGTYFISGCPAGGSLNTYCLQISKNEDSGNNLILGYDFGEGTILTLTEETKIQLGIVVSANCPAVSNLKFYAMVEKGTIAHPYQPYTKSRDSIIEQIVVDNLIDSNFNNTAYGGGWVRTGSFNYKDGKATFTASGEAGRAYHCKDYYLEKGKTYTVSANISTAESQGGMFGIMKYSAGTWTTVVNSKGSKTRCEQTFTVPTDAESIRINFCLYNASASAGTEITFSEMMLEEGAVAHPYQPYGLSRKGITEQIIAENLLLYPYRNTSKVVSGITWTDNEDGTIKANGTNSIDGQNLFTCSSRTGQDNRNPVILPAGTYTLSGCPKGGSGSTYYIQVGRTLNGAWNSLGTDYGDGVTFTLTEETQLQIQPVIASKATVSNIVFKPMLEVGSVAHPYTEYRKSPTKLREDLDTLMVDTGWITLKEAGDYTAEGFGTQYTVINPVQYRVVGKQLFVRGYISISFSSNEEEFASVYIYLPEGFSTTGVTPHRLIEFDVNTDGTVGNTLTMSLDVGSIYFNARRGVNGGWSIKTVFYESVLLD